MEEKEIDVLTTHLPHELTMLQYCLEQVNDSSADTSSNPEDPSRIMAFECFWLHAGNLIEFFRTESPTASTVSPHIFTKTEIDYGFGSRDLMDRINAQITHLQRNRGLSASDALTGADIIEAHRHYPQRHARRSRWSTWKRAALVLRSFVMTPDQTPSWLFAETLFGAEGHNKSGRPVSGSASIDGNVKSGRETARRLLAETGTAAFELQVRHSGRRPCLPSSRSRSGVWPPRDRP
jgi:hypothetical protein